MILIAKTSTTVISEIGLNVIGKHLIICLSIIVFIFYHSVLKFRLIIDFLIRYIYLYFLTMYGTFSCLHSNDLLNIFNFFYEYYYNKYLTTFPVVVALLVSSWESWLLICLRLCAYLKWNWRVIERVNCIYIDLIWFIPVWPILNRRHAVRLIRMPVCWKSYRASAKCSWNVPMDWKVVCSILNRIF